MNNGVKIYFLILLISILSGCGRSKDVKQITYSFSVDLEDPFNVFIAYKDSDGYKTLYIDREWTKDVYLGSGGCRFSVDNTSNKSKNKIYGKDYL